MGRGNGHGQEASAAELQRRPTLLPLAGRFGAPPAGDGSAAVARRSPAAGDGSAAPTRLGDVSSWDPRSPAAAPPVETPALFDAFQAAYERMRTSGKLVFGASVNVHALAELLISKGIITREEMDLSREAVEDDVQNAYVEAGLGVKFAADAGDKYDRPADELPEIDCADRIPLCKAACCTFRWALSEQDVVEGIVQWDLTNPYVNRVAADGYCVHCDSASKACGIYQNRPTICRTYDCRKDPRIWQDFEARAINPDLYRTLAEKRGERGEGDQEAVASGRGSPGEGDREAVAIQSPTSPRRRRS